MTVETDAGRIVLAGQAVGGATDYSRARYAWGSGATGPARRSRCRCGSSAARISTVRVLFAHDTTAWGPVE
jgi:hypothetical protein